MQVMAFSTHSNPQWRWRIVNFDGEMVEESRQAFPTISVAIAEGANRMRELSLQDLPARNHLYLRGAAHRRAS
jgi:hypothetical protein